MDFATNINRICKDRGTTLTGLCKTLGIATNKVSAWNHGSLPKQDMMVRLAQELDCSVMDFFADELDITDDTMVTLDDDEKEIVRIFRSLDRRNKHEFMSMVYDIEKREELTGDNGSTQSDVG